MRKIIYCLVTASFLVSCKTKTSLQKSKLHETVLTKETQQLLTPESVLEGLKEGNTRFQKNALTPRNLPKQVQKVIKGQYPEAIVLSCIDSRVPVEMVFDKGIGDLFVARVAGNIVSPEILGSMEYSCAVAGAKAVVVMGHERCGAVKAAIDNVQEGNISALSQNIKTAVEQANDFHKGEKTSKNYDYVNHIAHQNVETTIQKIRQQSSILKNLEEKGVIKIVGAIYSLETGKVHFINE